MKPQYVHITPDALEALKAGKDVELEIGKRIKRVLTTKTLFDIEKEKIEAKYKAELAKLEMPAEVTSEPIEEV